VSPRAGTGTYRNEINPRLKERLAVQAASAGIDAHPIFANAEEYATRTGSVRNVDGLAVTWVNKAIREVQSERRLRSQQLSREQEAYSKLHVELYRLISLHRLGPRAIADLLENARAAGYGQVNPLTIDRLRRLGDFWPDDPAAPDSDWARRL